MIFVGWPFILVTAPVILIVAVLPTYWLFRKSRWNGLAATLVAISASFFVPFVTVPLRWVITDYDTPVSGLPFFIALTYEAFPILLICVVAVLALHERLTGLFRKPEIDLTETFE